MLHFSKLKIFSILAVCFFAILFAAPSFISKDLQNSLIAKILPTSKVSLGLDLRGGSQLLLEVDSQYYIKEQLNTLKDELKISFRKDSIRALPTVTDNKIIFSLDQEEQKKR